MEHSLLNFNYTIQGIEFTVLSAISENERIFNEIIASPELAPDTVIQALETMDSNLASACAGIQHLFNVFPKKEIIEGYQLVAPELYKYASKITHSQWLKDYIDATLKIQLPLEQKIILKHYQKTMQSMGCYLRLEEKKQLSEFQQTLNAACELFEINIQSSLVSVITENGEIVLDENKFQMLMDNENNESIRKRAYKVYANRASSRIFENEKHDNTNVILNIVNTRSKIAHLFGFENFWNYSLSKKAFSETDKIKELLENILKHCIPRCQNILQDIKQTLSLEEEISPWTLDYYLNQAIQKKYSIDFNKICDYYPIHKVLDGIIKLAGKLFCIEIKRINYADTWHSDIIIFEVVEQGKTLGFIYADLFARDHKRGSSWVDAAQGRRKLGNGDYQVPIVFINCNFSPVSPRKPALLTQNDLVILLHEFGHVLHHLLAEGNYATLSGMNGVALDETEIPSMFFEKFAFEKDFIDLFRFIRAPLSNKPVNAH